MSMVRVGIMSFAHHHAEVYARILQEIDDVVLVGFADDDDDRATTIARDFALTRFSSYEALLDQGLDAVLVCSENALHRQHVEAAVGARVQILCEKPLATTSADARAMVAMCADAGVILHTAFPMRFSEPIRRAKRLIADGALGEVRGIDGLNQGRVPDEFREWFLDPVLSGGGAITDHVAHLLDAFRWLLDDEVESVYAQANTVIGANEFEVETAALVAMTFARGAIATIDCSWSRPHSFPVWGGLSMRVAAQKGTLEVDAFSERLSWYSDSVPGIELVEWGADSTASMLRAFVEAVAEADVTFGNGVDGLRASEVADAAYESVRTGRAVALAGVLTS